MRALRECRYIHPLVHARICIDTCRVMKTCTDELMLFFTDPTRLIGIVTEQRYKHVHIVGYTYSQRQ
jgi:hypothetical protein